MSYQQFRRQFAVLVPAQLRAGPLLDHKAATEAILGHLELDTASYRLGLSQVSVRACILRLGPSQVGGLHSFLCFILSNHYLLKVLNFDV